MIFFKSKLLRNCFKSSTQLQTHNLKYKRCLLENKVLSNSTSSLKTLHPILLEEMLNNLLFLSVLKLIRFDKKIQGEHLKSLEYFTIGRCKIKDEKKKNHEVIEKFCIVRNKFQIPLTKRKSFFTITSC